MQRRMIFQRGFTMIEILIVVAIIGVLTTLGISMYVTSQKNARDAQRLSNTKQMQNAMEQYFTTNVSSYTDGCSELDNLMQGGIPTDPQTGTALGCVETSAGADYCVYADVESDKGNCNVTGTTCTRVSDSTGTHICQTGLQ